jgi:putative pyruvate formate lyase activating enzyme
MPDFNPRYVELYESGELREREERLTARLESCDICPRCCGDNRLKDRTGKCHTGTLAIVASVGAHHGEEPVLSGTRGSGTIFFANCNLKCRYCQNWQISQQPELQRGNEVTAGELAGKMLYLQDELHCHNINLVTPSHVVPQIVSALVEAVPRGLRLPIVYNTSSYDALNTLEELDGIADIYLADLRYASDDYARKYSRARGYSGHARAAIKEMYRQVGEIVLDDEGIALRGLIVRHLILPGDIAGSEESLRWLTENTSPSVAVSIMSQYFPAHKAAKYKELNRKITYGEYRRVADLAEKFGMENGWMQEMEAPEYYRPDFTQEKPFSD